MSNAGRLRKLLQDASRELALVANRHGVVVDSDDRARRLLGIVPGTALPGILHPRAKGMDVLRRGRHETIERVELAVEHDGRLRMVLCTARPTQDGVAFLCSLVPEDYGTALQAMGAALSDIVDLNRQAARQRRDLERLNAELTEAGLGIQALLAEVEERAEAASALALRRSKAIATASHELRTPIQALRWSAEALVESAPEMHPAEVQRQLVGIARMSTELAHLVDDLLDVTKLEGESHVRPRRFRVSELLAALRGMIRPVLAEGMDVRLVIDDAPEDIELTTDFGKLVQILRNLLTNGLRHTAHGEVRLATEAHRERIRFDVHDTGPGIATEDRERIFEDYVRLTTSPSSGTGLGLPIARRLAGLLGGEITLESDVGRGSTFTLWLPRALAVPEAGARPVRSTSEAAAVPLRVLVIEDDEDTALLLTRLLHGSGHVVEAVRDGETGVSAALDAPPDVALVDVGLPGIDGYTVARRLRADPRTHHVRLVALTGHGSEADLREGRAAGFSEHLVKPLDRADVLGAVADLADQADGDVQTPSTP